MNNTPSTKSHLKPQETEEPGLGLSFLDERHSYFTGVLPSWWIHKPYSRFLNDKEATSPPMLEPARVHIRQWTTPNGSCGLIADVERRDRDHNWVSARRLTERKAHEMLTCILTQLLRADGQHTDEDLQTLKQRWLSNEQEQPSTEWKAKIVHDVEGTQCDYYLVRCKLFSPVRPRMDEIVHPERRYHNNSELEVYKEVKDVHDRSYWRRLSTVSPLTVLRWLSEGHLVHHRDLTLQESYVG